MTTAQAVVYFQVLIDKYGSPSVEADDVYSFLNHGLNEYMNRLLPDSEGGIVNWEQDENVVANLRPLIFDLTLTPSSGLLTVAAINAALVSASHAGAEYLRVGSLGTGTATPIRYMKQNNRWAFARNYFKRPSLSAPRYAVLSTGLQIYPTTITGSVFLNVIKKPRVISASVDPELGDYQMYNVIAIATQLAGVSLRDEEIVQDIRNIAVQNAK